jgi:hypothetical protein
MVSDPTHRPTTLNSDQTTALAETSTESQPPGLAEDLAREVVAAVGQEVARELLQDERVRQAAKAGVAVGSIAFGLYLLGSMAGNGTQPTAQGANYGR